MKKLKNNKMLLGIGITFLLLATIGISYAWFSATVKEVDVKDQVVTTGTLELTYTDGPEIKLVNARPGATLTKEIKVKNTGTLDAEYNLVWQVLKNEITNDEMVMSLTCQRLNKEGKEEEKCEGLDETPIKENIVLEARDIPSGYTHVYTITVTFKELSKDQNYNQGKNFTGVLGVEEYKETTPVSFSTDSWDTIVTAVKKGNTDAYNLGDTKEIDLGDIGKHTVRIANKSTPSECSADGFSQTACGFVLEFTDSISSSKFHPDINNRGGWAQSIIKKYINDTVLNSLPTELSKNIIETYGVSGHTNLEGQENFTTTDKLYLLAPKEVINDWNKTDDTAKDLTRTLDYYENITSNNDRLKKYNGNNEFWWLRTSSSSDGTKAYSINTNGIAVTMYINTGITFGVSPAFRIG